MANLSSTRVFGSLFVTGGIDGSSIYTISDDTSETDNLDFPQGLYVVSWQSGNSRADQIGAVLLVDAENQDSTVIGSAASTNVLAGSLGGTAGSDGNFNIGVRSDGKVDLENRTGGNVTVSASSRR